MFIPVFVPLDVAGALTAIPITTVISRRLLRWDAERRLRAEHDADNATLSATLAAKYPATLSPDEAQEMAGYNWR